MRLSRVVVRNYRAIEFFDIAIDENTTVVIGENNAGKTSLVHGLRLCLDAGLSSNFRLLAKDDVYCAVDQTAPFHVLVGVEFTDFEGNENEEALLHGTQIAPDRARLFYRFRPKRAIREAIDRNQLDRAITLDDYGWELRGGGNIAVDLANLQWNQDLGEPVNLQYLQSYLVVFLPALRDVEQDLQHTRRSSLLRLVEANQIPIAEQQVLIDAIRNANDSIEASPAIQAVATSIDGTLKEITGPAFALDVELGLSSPTFQSLMRNLIVLLSNALVTQFEPRRNGLGLNNILYIAMLIEHFRKRVAGGSAAGELILIEEPEAHLHPQLQATMMDALRAFPFQVIATTHSTQVTAGAPLSSYVIVTQQGAAPPHATTPARIPALTEADKQDLERYLDATKSNLLFARRVMLVEGAAELLLIPALAKRVMNIDLEREGISVVAVHGTHFGPFARLFSEGGLPKRCAIVADADMIEDVPAGDDVRPPANLAALAGPFVRPFVGATTFERELTLPANLPMLAATAQDLGAPRAQAALAGWIEGLEPIEALRDQVLRTANRFGKARFAQVATRHIQQAGAMPQYIRNAIDWLRE